MLRFPRKEQKATSTDLLTFEVAYILQAGVCTHLLEAWNGHTVLLYLCLMGCSARDTQDHWSNKRPGGDSGQ